MSESQTARNGLQYNYQKHVEEGGQCPGSGYEGMGYEYEAEASPGIRVDIRVVKK
jgi:hypothetical protein